MSKKLKMNFFDCGSTVLVVFKLGNEVVFKCRLSPNGAGAMILACKAALASNGDFQQILRNF